MPEAPDDFTMPPETPGERAGHIAALSEISWLIDNSDGVVGLRVDGGVMPWSEVAKLYLPSWRVPAGSTNG